MPTMQQASPSRGSVIRCSCGWEARGTARDHEEHVARVRDDGDLHRSIR